MSIDRKLMDKIKMKASNLHKDELSNSLKMPSTKSNSIVPSSLLNFAKTIT